MNFCGNLVAHKPYQSFTEEELLDFPLCICYGLTPANRCPATSRKAKLIMHNSLSGGKMPSLWKPSTSSFFTRKTWNIYLVSLGQVYWLCPLPASGAPPTSPLAGQHEEVKSPWLCVSSSLQQLKPLVYCHDYFSPKIQNTALHYKEKHHSTKKINSIPAKTMKELFFLWHSRKFKIQFLWHKHFLWASNMRKNLRKWDSVSDS